MPDVGCILSAAGPRPLVAASSSQPYRFSGNELYTVTGLDPNDGKFNDVKILSGSAGDPIVIAHEMIHMLGGNNKGNHTEDGLMQDTRIKWFREFFKK